MSERLGIDWQARAEALAEKLVEMDVARLYAVERREAADAERDALIAGLEQVIANVREFQQGKVCCELVALNRCQADAAAALKRAHRDI